jgi:hypothetical protein
VTAAVLDRPGTLFAHAPGRDERPTAAGAGTLHELLDSALHRAQATGSAECPVCHARMTYTRVRAECGGCGSRLS